MANTGIMILSINQLRQRGLLYLARAEEIMSEDDSHSRDAADLAVLASAYFNAARERAAGAGSSDAW